jgi:hypothetical protein
MAASARPDVTTPSLDDAQAEPEPRPAVDEGLQREFEREVVRVPVQQAGVGVSVEVSLTGDDLADPDRAKAILQALRDLAELGGR